MWGWDNDMDVFKLAFETIVVGLLAFLWLGTAIDLLSPSFFTQKLPAFVRDNQTLIGVGGLSLAYCLGSAISPISGQLVNDEHWPLNLDAIRCWVSIEEDRRMVDTKAGTRLVREYESLNGLTDCHCSYWDIFFPPAEGGNQRTFKWPSRIQYVQSRQAIQRDPNKEKILTIFRLRESKILSQGSDKTEVFRQLRERITVLRGAVFSGFLLFLISLFGCVAPVYHEAVRWRKTEWGRPLIGTALAVFFCFFAVKNGIEDLRHPDIFDMPVLEGLLGLITLFGGFLAFYGVRPRPYLKVRFLLVVGCFFALTYGGWMWSEVIYDQQVINSCAVSQTVAETVKP
jgi:hypothetical protein